MGGGRGGDEGRFVLSQNVSDDINLGFSKKVYILLQVTAVGQVFLMFLRGLGSFWAQLRNQVSILAPCKIVEGAVEGSEGEASPSRFCSVFDQAASIFAVSDEGD